MGFGPPVPGRSRRGACPGGWRVLGAGGTVGWGDGRGLVGGGKPFSPRTTSSTTCDQNSNPDHNLSSPEQDYCDLYLGPKDSGVPRVYERVNDRWGGRVDGALFDRSRSGRDEAHTGGARRMGPRPHPTCMHTHCTGKCRPVSTMRTRMLARRPPPPPLLPGGRSASAPPTGSSSRSASSTASAPPRAARTWTTWSTRSQSGGVSMGVKFGG